jgi:antitoxin (DNA-binding transcriptional repressor) of toxin-antitoxin stability system
MEQQSRDQTVKTIKLSQASRTLAEYAAELSNEIVLLAERNKVVAAIVPLKGVNRESIALSGHPGFLRIIARSRAQFRRGQTMSLAEMKAAFGDGRSPRKRLQPTKARQRRGASAALLRAFANEAQPLARR